MANTAWNPSDLSGVTLSGSNLIATSNSSTGSSNMNWVRAADFQQTGKFYWEITMTTWAGANTAACLATKACVPATWNAAGLLAIYNDGDIRIAGNVIVSGFTGLVSGAVMCFALDLTNGLFWARVGAAGNWNASSTANPVTGAGGVSLATMGVGGAFGAYPAATFTAASDKVTANFGGSAFAGVVPAGFTSGFTSGAAFSTSALVTQVTVEQWATTATIAGQAIVTQVALEQWVPAAKPAVELAGNLGGAFQYGKLAYGKGQYSRISAFAPIFAADLTIAPVANFSGDLTPTIVLAADLDVHVNLIDFAGGLVPQIALGGSLSLDLPLTALDGSFGFTAVYGAPDMISGPLWAGAEPCPSPPWAPSEPCLVPPWMTTAPCDPVVWSKSRLCNG